MNKILVSDYDRTLYRNEEEIKKNVEMIGKWRADGNLFVIATGRSYESLLAEIKKYSIPYDYIILNHGMVLLNYENHILQSEFLLKEDVIAIFSKLNRMDVEVFFCTLFEDTKKYQTNICKLEIFLHDPNVLESLERFLKNNHFDITYFVMSNNSYILVEIIRSGVDKSKAISTLVEMIETNDIFVIGDGENDITMIEKYHGYAIENAVPKVLEIAEATFHQVSELIEMILK